MSKKRSSRKISKITNPLGVYPEPQQVDPCGMMGDDYCRNCSNCTKSRRVNPDIYTRNTIVHINMDTGELTWLIDRKVEEPIGYVGSVHKLPSICGHCKDFCHGTCTWSEVDAEIDAALQSLDNKTGKCSTPISTTVEETTSSVISLKDITNDLTNDPFAGRNAPSDALAMMDSIVESHYCEGCRNSSPLEYCDGEQRDS